MNDQAERLRNRYDDFYLLRNEKAVKVFAFENGQAFEPDFVLFLRKKGAAVNTIFQLFIEPKGDHLIQTDSWKEAFLKDIEGHGRIETVFQGRDYSVYGLPFFNETAQSSTDSKGYARVPTEVSLSQIGQNNTGFKTSFARFLGNGPVDL